jgi:hypothetical protein
MEKKLNWLTRYILICVGAMCFPMQAHADFGVSMCNIAAAIIMIEPVVATVLMIKMGIMALYGRLTWNLAILHFVGMGLIVGAGGIASMMTGVAACP